MKWLSGSMNSSGFKMGPCYSRLKLSAPINISAVLYPAITVCVVCAILSRGLIRGDCRARTGEKGREGNQIGSDLLALLHPPLASSPPTLCLSQYNLLECGEWPWKLIIIRLLTNLRCPAPLSR